MKKLFIIALCIFAGASIEARFGDALRSDERKEQIKAKLKEYDTAINEAKKASKQACPGNGCSVFAQLYSKFITLEKGLNSGAPIRVNAALAEKPLEQIKKAKQSYGIK